MEKLEVKRVQEGLGIVLLQDALQRLNVGEGGSIFLVEIPGGGYALTTQDHRIGAQLKKAEDIMARYRNTLRKLAE